jgi:hypothetical protein
MNKIGKRVVRMSGKRWVAQLKSSITSWRSLRESNPSFQIENLTS